MKKLSKAEKLRRKEERIYNSYDYLLSYLRKAYLEDPSEIDRWHTVIIYFTRGCVYADGRKWYKRLNDRFIFWMKENQNIIAPHHTNSFMESVLFKELSK